LDAGAAHGERAEVCYLRKQIRRAGGRGKKVCGGGVPERRVAECGKSAHAERRDGESVVEGRSGACDEVAHALYRKDGTGCRCSDADISARGNPQPLRRLNRAGGGVAGEEHKVTESLSGGVGLLVALVGGVVVGGECGVVAEADETVAVGVVLLSAESEVGGAFGVGGGDRVGGLGELNRGGAADGEERGRRCDAYADVAGRLLDNEL